MAYNYEYPYTDYERYNADWALNLVKDLERKVAEISAKVDKIEGDVDGFKDEINRQFDELRKSLTEEINNYFNQINQSLDTMRQDIETFKNNVENRISQFEAQIPDLVDRYLEDNSDIAELKLWMSTSKTILSTWQNRIFGNSGTIHIYTTNPGNDFRSLSIVGCNIDIILMPVGAKISDVLLNMDQYKNDICIVDCRTNQWKSLKNQEEYDNAQVSVAGTARLRKNATYFIVRPYRRQVLPVDACCHIGQFVSFMSSFAKGISFENNIFTPISSNILAIDNDGEVYFDRVVINHRDVNFPLGFNLFPGGPIMSKVSSAILKSNNNVMPAQIDNQWNMTAFGSPASLVTILWATLIF